MNQYHYNRNRRDQFHEEWDDYVDENIPYEEENSWDETEEYDMWDDEEEEDY
ncbi:MAG: hypothetical protein ACW96X_13840 [Promethearchaeota archaeon]|jgi:hypothetical protein